VSALFVKPADPRDVVEHPEHVIVEVNRPPVLITEQEVVFGTAATVGLPRTKPTHSLIAALRAKLRSSSQDAPPIPRHYPSRRDQFLEDAAMEREMHRL
jgi:hypothetical protein